MAAGVQQEGHLSTMAWGGGGGGVSVWPLTALATLRGRFPGTVQGLATNCSYGSSDSAPREASVPGLSLAQLPLEVPATGSSLPTEGLQTRPTAHPQLTPVPRGQILR